MYRTNREEHMKLTTSSDRFQLINFCLMIKMEKYCMHSAFKFLIGFNLYMENSHGLF